MAKKMKPRASMLTLVLGNMACQGRVCVGARIPAARRCSHTKAAVVCKFGSWRRYQRQLCCPTLPRIPAGDTK
ncbi:hypothetical protein PR003_g21241 [Phytophthora rubi]|uniref:Secreted protein n=1 Tax=Phytophthora rubi TaxID=129364 RepID=A0A6A3KZ05_9STRA|nr:hypothetical protein PR002_g16209 [Phytophthora rubi]KAE9010755.1 hypothetical protein PR001_g16084 [Phytophthora rubi]KAE9306431.1 hypothetical protein PR003_g21241 [Phytophthora rubi]